ncbi:GNAT family N-acetyltransferase [Bradyrhizobium sp. LMG 9283]|uniref:GNAT family N-acetyltransferase n=1 Tax=Bradyrhizobium sp. LMG 9283 TaxID=592064 RepID=UPI00388DFA77
MAELIVSSGGPILPANTTSMRGNQLEPSIIIRPFTEEDAEQVRLLFVIVNRLLAPAHMAEAFEAYIATSLNEEIGQISQYYECRQGGFWVAVGGEKVIGMFGLEPSSPGAMELRRMYVHPDARRRGIARRMLRFAEDECRKRNRPRMDLSTSELQRDALSLYRASGYQLVREEMAVATSNKSLGGGIRRYHFTKQL